MKALYSLVLSLVCFALSCKGRSTIHLDAPHEHVADVNSPKQVLLAQLLDHLWQTYRLRVPFVRQAQEVLGTETILNDHVAFRSLDISSISRIFEALGYLAKGTYNFNSKHLTAIHYEHISNPNLPKIFISELKVWELHQEAREIVEGILQRSATTLPPKLTPRFLARLHNDPAAPELLLELLDYFETVHYSTPTRQELETLHRHSQYAAWVLLFGNRPNHFTFAVRDIDNVFQRLNDADFPMKDRIEGAPKSRLRQVATRAAQVELDDHVGSITTWPYAYVEFAERIPDPITGEIFQGFLGPQASQLFDMTTTAELSMSDTATREL